jgi:ABC-2 type transport system permease protein
MLLVMRREYLERVQKKSFLVMTIVVPALMAAVIWIPVKYASRSSLEKRSVTIVAPTQQLADAVRTQLLDYISHEDDDPFSAQSSDKHEPEATNRADSRYTVDTSTAVDDSARENLRRQVNDGKLSGFLWIDPESLQKRTFTYFSKDSTNFSEQISLKSAVRTALTQQALVAHGFNEPEVKQVLKPVTLNAVRVLKGKESKNNGVVLFLATITMVTLLYVTVLIYGLAVMRSVIEEKSSRIMEVMLSSVTTRDMMGGKIIGVGAVGLTQIGIWILLSISLSAPAMLALKNMAGGVHLSVSTIAFFALFFLLGYLLYSTLYAAIGAIVNSEQEAQQIQFIILLPLIFAMIIAQTVIQHPSSQLAIWTSMIPFCAPMLMFVRILVETPPWWQIVLCVALMLATIWGLLLLCARIYRVGVLMYGKRPTLPELVKWLRYAG